MNRAHLRNSVSRKNPANPNDVIYASVIAGFCALKRVSA